MLSRLRSVAATSLRAGLRPLGLTVQRVSAVPSWQAFFDQIHAHKVGIRTVLDIGVHDGSADLYAEFPHAALYLFDHRPKAIQFMTAVARNRRAKTFNVSLGVAPGRSRPHAALGRPEVVPFDDLIGRFPKPALCKMTVPGAEMNVLRGMTAHLPAIDYFVIETNTFSSSPDADEFPAVCRFMDDRGFSLYDILSLQRRTSDGALGRVDVAFVSRSSPLRSAFRPATEELRPPRLNGAPTKSAVYPHEKLR